MAGELRSQGRVALVTGVSRPAGIGYAVAERLESLGAVVVRSVAFLVSDDGGWIQGQVIDAEGGFHRFGVMR